MDVTQLINFVNRYSPAIASVLSSPLGELAKYILAKTFNANPEDDHDLIKKITQDKKAIDKMKSLEILLTMQHNNRIRSCLALLAILGLIVTLTLFFGIFYTDLSAEITLLYVLIAYLVFFSLLVVQTYNFYFKKDRMQYFLTK